jgi:hypothetical protein
MHTFNVDYSDYQDFEDARQQIGRWIDEIHMKQRIHSALDYLTGEFEAAFLDTAQCFTLNG